MPHIDAILQEARLTDQFYLRSFSASLSALLKDRGYKGSPDDTRSLVHFLYSRYEASSIPITRASLRSWFAGESRPLFESRSRKRMYELCFALNLTYEQVRDFFEHVYLSRGFNCRNILEAVYCRCFSAGEDYLRACSLYEQARSILSSPEFPPNKKAPIPFTGDMERDIQNLQSDQDFLDYVKINADSFREYNQSAKRELKRLLGRIQGSKNDQELVNAHRKNQTPLSSPEYDRLEGLAVKEYFLYHHTCRDLKGQNVASADFMLSQILGIRLDQYYGLEAKGRSFSKDGSLPLLAKINFPSSQSLSDILKGKEHVSFDAVRKMVILLHFYSFFVSAVLSGDRRDLSQAYEDDAGDQLAAAGYGPLYRGSPYDRIFLESAGSDQPLDAFRGMILEAAETE